MENTWFKLYRTILIDDIFTNPENLKVWIWLLCKACFEPKTVVVGRQQVDLKTGQLIFGRRAAAMQLQMNESKVYRIIRFLKDKGCIDLEGFSKYSIITVNNWSKYQGAENFFAQNSKQQMNNNQTSYELPMDTIKNLNNYNNLNNYSSLPQAREDDDDEFDEDYCNPYYHVPMPMGGTLGKGVLMLSEEQEEHLLDIMPINLYDYYCDKLSTWIVKKKRKVADHYNLILKWFREDYPAKQQEV